MTFPDSIYLLAFAGALATSFLSLPAWTRWCRWTGHLDDPGARKIHSESIPLAGGLAVATGFLVPVGLAALGVTIAQGLPGWSAEDFERLQYGFGARRWQLAAIVAGLAGMMILGWLDDRHELGPLAKFSGQFLIAALVTTAGVRVTLFIPSIGFSYLITILWIVGVTNALNFLDNMNGLCTGITAIAAACFGIAAANHGQYLVASIAFAGCGAHLGFLPWNYPRARAFLGDAGSHLAGFLLAVLSILPTFHSETHPRPLAVLSPLLVLVVPLVDLASVVILRLRRGLAPWKGDTNHLSHRLVRSGWSPRAAVALLWVAGLAGGAAALAL